jgi:hypothetical protein
MEARHVARSLGARFVEALTARDHARLASLLHPDVDFRGMTPGRFWQASTATQVVDEVLRSWFDDNDQIDEVLQVETTRVADRERVGYRLAVSNRSRAWACAGGLPTASTRPGCRRPWRTRSRGGRRRC